MEGWPPTDGGLHPGLPHAPRFGSPRAGGQGLVELRPGAVPISLRGLWSCNNTPAVLLRAVGLPSLGSTPFLTDSDEEWNALLCFYGIPIPLGTMLDPRVPGINPEDQLLWQGRAWALSRVLRRGQSTIYKMPPAEPLQTSFSKCSSGMMGWERELFIRLALGSLCRSLGSQFLRENPASLCFCKHPSPKLASPVKLKNPSPYQSWSHVLSFS